MDEHARWLDRDLSAKQYVYFWVDGIFQARLEDDAQCLLVIIGAMVLCTQTPLRTRLRPHLIDRQTAPLKIEEELLPYSVTEVMVPTRCSNVVLNGHRASERLGRHPLRSRQDHRSGPGRARPRSPRGSHCLWDKRGARAGNELTLKSCFKRQPCILFRQ